ncbi:hypothetical protein HGM15179_000294 [Zosterops borbonicus]|uniref:Uncharacterized protein n=1 Tax=Zosterops borbonicus TaxID=364589 RepID=A0A8K1LUJ4_9PASS|nr:hypothetical protein HGM15179_000294 [Zosterops borbonicus]
MGAGSSAEPQDGPGAGAEPPRTPPEPLSAEDAAEPQAPAEPAKGKDALCILGEESNYPILGFACLCHDLA